MKTQSFKTNLLLCSIALLFVFTCCNNHPLLPELNQAEQIIETKPDSALKIIESIKNPEKLSEKEYATYCLLLTQAQDKNYVTHTSDSLIKIAVNYFEKQDDKCHTIFAYYYMGRVYSDLQDALQAQEYYLKALSIKENHTDNRMIARIYNNLGMIYAYQDIYEMALSMHKEALQYLKLEEVRDSINISFVLRNIARVFTLTNQADSAICYYEQAIQYSTPKNISSILNDLGNIYLNKQEYKEADESLNKAIAAATNQTAYYPIYLSKGELMIKTNQLDSAKYYLMLSLESPNIYTKAGSYYNLAKVAKALHNFEEYTSYMEQYLPLQDSTSKHSHFENIRVVQSMFNYQLIAKEKAKFEKESKDRMITIYQLITFVIAILTGSYFVYQKEMDKRKRLKDINEIRYRQSQQFIQDNERQIAKYATEIIDNKKQLSEVEKRFRETKKLMLEMENRRVHMYKGEARILEEGLYISEVYLKAHRENAQFSKSEWLELQALIDATYVDFTKRLQTALPKISTEELHICHLVKIGVSVKIMASIINISASGVSQCRRRLYKKLTGKPENAEEFDKFILDL